MTFFYNLNDKLNAIREKPETTHKQLNERDMGKHNNKTTGFDALAKKAGKEYGSKAAGERVAGAQFQKMKKSGKIEEEGMSRAAKGYEKYGKAGMQALAKAGREGKALDPVRNKYDKYDNKEVDEGLGDMARKVGSAVKKVGGAVLNRLGHGSDKDMRKDLQKKMGMPQTGKKPQELDELSPATLTSYAGKRSGQAKWAGGVAKQLASRPPERPYYRDSSETDPETDYGPQGNKFAKFNQQARSNIKKAIGKGATPNTQDYDQAAQKAQGGYGDASNPVTRKKGMAEEGGAPMTAKQKSFAKLAPPADKITFADKIAGAKKEVDEMLGDVAAEAIKGALSSKQKKIDMNKNGKLDANDFAMLRRGGNKQVADEGVGQFYVYHKTKGDRAGGADYDLLKTFPDKDSATSFAQKYNNKISADKKNFHSAVVRTKSVKKDMDEGWDEMEKDVKSRMGARRVGDVTHGDKHDTEEIPGGRRVTRRVDPNTGYSVGADSDEPAAGEKRGRGRPKSASGPRQERVTAKSRKADRTAYSKKKTNEDDFDITDRGEYDQEGEMAKDDIKTIVRHAQALEKILGDNDNLPEWVQAKLAKIEGMMTAVDDYMQNQEDDEMAMGEEKTSTRDNRAERAGRKVAKDIEYDEKKKDGIHGKKRGSEDARAEKAGKKVAKDIEYDEKKDKPKKVKEAGGTDTPTASSGFGFGQGIYDSMNRELETMIRESMNVSMNMNTDATGGPSKSVTVTATDDDALKLGELLKNAGLGGHDYPHIEGGADMDHPGAIEVNGTMDADGAEQLAQQIRQAMGDHDHAEGEVCDACGQEDCGCETVDEAYGDDVVSQNEPDFPTNTETAQDSFEYSGGLNGPKSTGQTTIPVIAGQEERMGADDLHRLREMAGIKEAAKPDFPDVDNDGDKKETIEKAVDDKKAAGDKKVAESLMAELQRFMKA